VKDVNTKSCENSGFSEMYSGNYIFKNAEYNVTDTHEVHLRLQSGKYICINNLT